MSKRNKLQKFAEILQLPNVYENYDPHHPALTAGFGKTVDLKGYWAERHFGNANPITLELACGRGEYTLALARRAPAKNFVGVDIKGARIWKGATIGLEEQLVNVAFLRTRIEQVALFFAPGEVDEIWITFPDPFPEKGKANRRLTAPRFLESYRAMMKAGGLLHLKTDDEGLYAFSLETLAAVPGAVIHYRHDDIYGLDELPFSELEVKTYYERMHLAAGKRIKYIRFSL